MAKAQRKSVRAARPPAAVIAKLAAFYRRNGYVRRQDEQRLGEEPEVYKKGDELRLVAQSRSELAAMRRLLKLAGFRPGASFVKGRQFRQPVYGKAEVARFLELVDDCA